MFCVHMSHEWWTSQGSLSCNPWKSVCHDWTATNATHSYMPSCDSILANTASWSISVCVDFVYVVWKLKIPYLVYLRAEGTFEPTKEMLCMESRINPLTWKVMRIYPTRQSSLRLCHRKHLCLTMCRPVFRPALLWDCRQHKVVIPLGDVSG